jgi:rubredoxin
LAECTDFKQEETALQFLASQLGVTVRLTPKFHAELAGEGVEYSWAHAKAYYRRMPLSRKRGRENFKQLVRDCTCPVNVLTKERIEKFASRARAYICTYHHLQQEHEKQQATAAANGDPNSPFVPRAYPKQEQLLYTEIERLMKEFKCHRCALDFDRHWVNSVLRIAKVKDD